MVYEFVKERLFTAAHSPKGGGAVSFNAAHMRLTALLFGLHSATAAITK